MAPKLSLKDLYGERGAQRFTQQRNPGNVAAARAYPNGTTFPGTPNAGMPPAVAPFRRVPGQGVSYPDVAGYGNPAGCCGGGMRIPGVAGFGAANLGAAFCRGVEPFLVNLAALLSAANQAGLNNDSVISAAQATYDDINGFLVYIPFIGTDCERHTTEVQAAIARVQARMAEAGVPPIDLPRPDAKPSDPYGVPTWMKVVAVAGVAALALGYLKPGLKLFGGRKQLALFPALPGYHKRRKKR